MASFYSALGFDFVRHRHGHGAEHLSSTLGGTVFEIYPASSPQDNTTSTRLGFSVPSLTNILGRLKSLDAVVLSEPSDTPFGPSPKEWGRHERVFGYRQVAFEVVSRSQDRD